jgi:hypothetical protein
MRVSPPTLVYQFKDSTIHRFGINRMPEFCVRSVGQFATARPENNWTDGNIDFCILSQVPPVNYCHTVSSLRVLTNR